MHRIALPLALALCGALALAPTRAQITSGGTPNLIYCNKISAATYLSGIAVVVTGIAGKATHVCGWTINSNTNNPTLAFAVGTGSTCANPLPNIPTYFLGNQGTITVNHLETAFVSLPSGLTICATVTGAASPSVSLTFYYAQF